MKNNKNRIITKRYHFENIDSTNKKARELAQEGCLHGTLVTADAQNAGIGRRGRNWSSEKDTGIYMSVVLCPNIETDEASMLTLVAAMAVEKAIEHVCQNGQMQNAQIEPRIKWPNDIVMNKKKVCGILTELSLKDTKIDFIVLGIGINVDTLTFPEEIAQTASSIRLETGQDVDKELLIDEIWRQFEFYYEQFLQTKDVSLFKGEYEKALINKEEKVKVLDPLGEYTGVARGITNTGELIVDTGCKTKYVSSGEVSVRGIYGYV